MLKAQIQKEDIRALNQLPDAGLYADKLLTATTLRQEFEGGAIKRKSFCEALDIGESTLSTWLQSDRIPRVAAVAYVMWLSFEKLSDEIRQRSELAAEVYVIRARDGYAVVQPGDPSTPDAVDQLIASGIETVELAREIAVARSPSFRKVLDQANEVLWSYSEQFERDGEENWVTQIAAAVERVRDFQGPGTSKAEEQSAPDLAKL